MTPKGRRLLAPEAPTAGWFNAGATAAGNKIDFVDAQEGVAWRFAAALRNQRSPKHVEGSSDGFRDRGSTPLASTFLIINVLELVSLHGKTHSNTMCAVIRGNSGTHQTRSRKFIVAAAAAGRN